MKRCVVGVMGHVDHGKTALVRALTGMETDRLPEEKARGISIAPGFAHFTANDDTIVDLIDMPGHEKFVRNMVAGSAGINTALLVVAANEAVQPQTIEHLDIAALMGLRDVIIAISKADLVEGAEVERVGQGVDALVAERGLTATSVILTSAQNGTGVEELRQALAAMPVPEKAQTSPSWFPIDRAFSIPGHGPVVTGTLQGAAVELGDELELWPACQRVRIRALQVHGEQRREVAHGQRVAINLRDVELSDLAPGMALAEVGSVTESEWLTIAVQSVTGAPTLKNGMELRALVGTEERAVRLRLLDCDLLQPGECGFAQLRFAEPIACPARKHVVLRLPSPARTAAGGMILEPVVRRRRRHDADLLERLTAMRDMEPEDFIIHEAGRRSGTRLEELARNGAMRKDDVRQLLARLPVTINRRGVILRKSDVDYVAAQIVGLIEAYPAGQSRNQLQTALPGVAAALLDAALDRLKQSQQAEQIGSLWQSYDPDRKRAEARNREAVEQELIDTLIAGGMTPPNPGTILTGKSMQQAAERLLRRGDIVRTVDSTKGREMLFHRDAIAAVQDVLEPALGDPPGLRVGEISALLGISRKYAMPLLAHFDCIGFTLRDGDYRMLAKPIRQEEHHDETAQEPV